MSQSLRARTRCQLGLAATFLAMLPGTALAADAPSRYVGIDPSGARTPNIHWVGVSEDAHELVGTLITASNGYVTDGAVVVDRDVVSGTTTALTGPDVSLVATSTDLRKLLVRTKRSLSPKDTNAFEDYYVLNRDTGQYTLASVDSTGKAIGNDEDTFGPGTDTWILNQPGFSGDGSVVQFSKWRVRIDADGVYSSSDQETDRVKVATAAVTKLPELDGSSGAYSSQMDDAGRVAVTDSAVYVDGVKTVDFPAHVWPPVISPDGGYIAAWDFNNHAIVKRNLSTGATASYALPQYKGGGETPTIRYVANGGSSIVLSDLVNADGLHLAFGRYDGSGNFSQLGNNVKYSDWEYLDAGSTDARVGDLGLVTRNQQFAVTSLTIAQLGTTPLPGTDPVTPSPAKVPDYLYIYDSTCHLGGFWNLFHVYTTPTVTLAKTPQRTDLRRPVSFTGSVSKTSTGQVLGTGTIAPGKPTDLPGTGINGGWQIDGTIKFDDGSTLAGTTTVATHANPVCAWPFPAS